MKKKNVFLKTLFFVRALKLQMRKLHQFRGVFIKFNEQKLEKKSLKAVIKGVFDIFKLHDHFEKRKKNTPIILNSVQTYSVLFA